MAPEQAARWVEQPALSSQSGLFTLHKPWAKRHVSLGAWYQNKTSARAMRCSKPLMTGCCQAGGGVGVAVR